MNGPSHLVGRIQDEYFAANVLDPQSWVHKADELWNAAELLVPTLRERWEKTRSSPEWRHLGGNPPLGLNSIRLMLCAYAFENLFKAAIVGRLSSPQAAQVHANGELPNGMASHKLVTLASRAKIKLTPEEAAELERMADAAVVFGRYPVPLNSARLFAEEPAAMRSMDANALIDADLHLPGLLFHRVRKDFS